MSEAETDYLIVGAGATGLAFADTVVAESDAHVTIVDRRGKPGGHWNDAYSFVTLHQPSAFYGVNSMELGSGRKDAIGLNRGLYELASGPEICGYFDRVMKQTLLPSGRVAYHPMSEYLGDGRIVSILSGAETRLRVRRKVVDANYQSPSVPATHVPKFEVGADAALVPPGALPQLWQRKGERPRHFMIIGAGKTAMDAAIWLIGAGAPADAISWVVPRDSWLVNRVHTQTGLDFFTEAIGGQADQMEACGAATSVDDLFERLEACGYLLRIDRSRKPTMFHLATTSLAEVEVLRTIRNIIRMGHVRAVEHDRLVLDEGSVALAAGTLCIDCTASAVEYRPTQPVFQGDRVVLQIARLPQPCFSAALAAHLELHVEGDAAKNRLCAPVPFPHTLQGYVAAMMVSMWNQAQWGQDKELRQWIRASRLDGYGKLVASADREDAAQQAIVGRLRAGAMAAMANMPRLMAAASR
jgi:NAD(P)-binding Rossmann-like domain